jgi:transposase
MGADIHKTKIQYCIVSEKRIIKEKELVTVIKQRKVKSIAIESTSQYHIKLVYYLLEHEIPVLLANPQQTKQTQGRKTDKLDARRIALAHRDWRLKPSVIPQYEFWMLRKAMRKLKQLTDALTKSKQRLSQFFHQKDFHIKKLLRSKTGIQLLFLVSQGTISKAVDVDKEPLFAIQLLRTIAAIIALVRFAISVVAFGAKYVLLCLAIKDFMEFLDLRLININLQIDITDYYLSFCSSGAAFIIISQSQ